VPVTRAGTHSLMRMWDWIDERTGVGELLELCQQKAVPQHRHSFWYGLGGLITVLFAIQIISGLLLLLYYQPTIERAHASVHRIITEVPLGWAIRSLHRWAADFAIVAVLLHFTSTLLLKAYRPPRELTWLTGCALLGLTLGFGFTGYLLPWDELSLAATKVGSGIPASLPVVGAWVTEVLRGGEDVTGDTLTRFFAFHVCYLPLLLATTMAIHFWLVQRLGMSLPPSVEADGREVDELPFCPDFLCREAIAWLAVVGIVITLALLCPTSLGPVGDLMAPAATGIKPEWYFLSFFQVLKVFPARVLLAQGESVAVLLALLAAGLLLLLPFLDRNPSGRSGRVIALLVRLALVFAVGIWIWGYLS